MSKFAAVFSDPVASLREKLHGVLAFVMNVLSFCTGLCYGLFADTTV